MLLRRQDFIDINAHERLAGGLFARHGLAYHASGDMDAFAAYIAGEEESWGASASHNPAHSFLTPANSFWIALKERDGTIVGSCTQKCVETENFMAEVFAHTLYDSRKPVLAPRLPDFHDGAEEDDFAFAGRICYGSGLFIRPDYRGKGLLVLSRLSRTIALRHFKAHWFVGIQRLTRSSRRHALDRQMFAHCKPFLRGMPYKWDGEFQLSWSSRAEWLEAIRREVRDAGRRRRAPSRAPAGRRRAEAAGSSRA